MTTPGNSCLQCDPGDEAGRPRSTVDATTQTDLDTDEHTTSPREQVLDSSHPQSSVQPVVGDDMTTYYLYHENNNVTSWPVEPLPCTPYNHSFSSHADVYGQPPRCATNIRQNWSEVGWGKESDHYSENLRYAGRSDLGRSDSGSSTLVDYPTPSNDLPYPDTEKIRMFHDLHSLLPYIQPERLNNALNGSQVNIVEEGTEAVFAYKVPKKMLVLFCGRPAIQKFLRTLEREDNVNWRGGPRKQELRLPRGVANCIGVRIVVAWMRRACYREHRGTMRPVTAPSNLFAAICLSRALEAFGLFRDSTRIDNAIVHTHLRRPLLLDEIKSIWTCLPKDSRYTYRMVQDLTEEIRFYEAGDKRALPHADQILEFLQQQPELERRVHDPEANNKFRPVFGTEWCKRVAEEQTGKKSEPIASSVKRFGVLRIVP